MIERADTPPPGYDAIDVLGLDGLAQLRHHELDAACGPLVEEHLRGLVPCVRREAERSPVNGKERAAQHRVRLQCILRAEVNVAPRRMEGAHFEHHEVEGTETRADVLILRCKPRVAAEE